MKLNKIAPWNWFKSEDEEDRQDRELHYGMVRSDRFHDEHDRHPLARLHREMDRLFDDFLPSYWPEISQKWWKLDDKDYSLLKPSVDISETKKNYKVRIEVPGVDKEGINVDVRNNSLVIRGEKKKEQVDEDEHYHRMERFYGSFQRILNLPPDAQTSDVDAKFKNGVLTLTVKRNPEKKVDGGHTIEIN